MYSSRRSLVVLVGLVLVLSSISLVAAVQQTPRTPLTLTHARAGHTATVLGDGRILVAGGTSRGADVAFAEVFDPATSMSSDVGIATGRTGHTATLMLDGGVLIAGGVRQGFALALTERFNPATNAFEYSPPMSVSRAGHSATLLPDGRIAIAGGDAGGTIEIFNGESSRLIAKMSEPRSGHSAIVLGDGTLFIAGGRSLDGTPLQTAEIFDPAAGQIVWKGRMTTARVNPALRLLPDGKLQVIGGDGAVTMEMFNTAQRYFIARAHLLQRPAPQLLRTPARAFVVSAVNVAANSEITANETARSGFSMTEVTQSRVAVMAGGVSASGSATNAIVLFEASPATITTDRTDYPPGTVVTVTGRGWAPGEIVTIAVTADGQADNRSPLISVTDELGNFTNTQFSTTIADLGVTFILTAVGGTSGYTALTTFTDGNPSANLDQCANGSPVPTTGCTEWVNGNLNESKAIYYEGDSVPYRLRFSNLTSGEHTVNIEWDTTKSGKWALDYLRTFNETVTGANPCVGVTACDPSSFMTYAIPNDAKVGVKQLDGLFAMYNGTITKVSEYSFKGTIDGDSSTGIVITFTTSVPNPVLAWGGHIATRVDWGMGNSAVSIPGSPYHMRVLDLDGSGGNQDRSLSAAAVIFPAKVVVLKDAVPADATTEFTFTPTGASFDGTQFFLKDGETKTFDKLVTFGSNTITEQTPPPWGYVTSSVCTADGVAGNLATGDAAITFSLDEAAVVNCTFTNVKKSLHLDKSASPATYDSVGDVISYEYLLTNDGGATLTAPYTVTDDKTTATCPSTPANLAPGDSVTCTATYTITQANLEAGSLTNVATGTAQYQGTTVTSNEDTATVTADQLPALSLVKTATPSTYDTVGDVISYSYKVTNSGNVTLSSPYAVTDDKATATCPATPASLAPGAFVTCTASYTITQADLDSGSVTNTAQATAKFGETTVTSNEDSETVNADTNPQLTLVKTATPSTYDSVGDVISYSYKLTNSGNVTLTAPYSVADDKSTDEFCPDTPATLAPNAFVTCTATYTITQADLDTGSVINTAKGHAFFGTTAVDSNEDSETVTADQKPALTLDKTATEENYDAVGDVIHYSYKLTNSGNVTLTAPFAVNDDKATDAACPATPASLAPGDSITCTASYTISQANLDAGSLTNIATATAKFGETTITSNEDTVTVTAIQSPALTLDKTATPTTYDAVGNVISYSYKVTNSGNVTLTQPITVADDKSTDESCPALPAGGFAPGAFITCTATYTISQSDLDFGSVTNIATASTTYKEVPVVSNQDTETVTAVQSPALTLVKTATPSTYDSVGDVISYSYLVTNSGNVTFAGPVTVTDDKATVTCPAGGLAPTASMTCTASYTITQSDLDAGSVTNTATAHSNGTDSNTDDETVTAVQSPALTIVKSATETTYSQVGDILHYTINVKNTGNTTLYNVTVSDPLVSDLTCTPANGATLAPNGTMSCTATHTISQADIDAGHWANAACVDDGDGGAAKVCDDEDVPGTKLPALTIVKTATETTYSQVGDILHYTINVKNTGNTTLYNVTVSDPLVSDLTCTPANGATLAPNGTMSCTATHTVSQADIDAGHWANSACVDDGDGGAAKVCDDEDVPGTKLPAITLTKTPSSTTYKAVGDVIIYTLVATNTGNQTLTNVSISDLKLGTLTCTQPVTLVPGATLSCTGSYAATQGDLDAGKIDNTATTKGTSPEQIEVTATARATVTAEQNPVMTVDKSSTTTRLSAPATVPYSYLVINTGNVTLTGITLTDDNAPAVSCPATTLAVGGSMTCTATHAFTEAELEAYGSPTAGSGQLTNIVTADSDQTTPVTDTLSIPIKRLPLLTLVKNVVNDNGGKASATDWTLTATGPTIISGAGGTGPMKVEPGTYALTESAGPSGYKVSDWVCEGGTQLGAEITLDFEQSATCTVTNDDLTAHLKLVKVVTNDNGGTAKTTDFTLTATGPTPLSGAGGAESDVNAGSYDLSETPLAGYTASAWTCEGGTLAGSMVTLALEESATCTVTNNDDPGTLIVKKIVINDNGGTKIATDFTFQVNGAAAVTFVQDGSNTLRGKNTLTLDAAVYDITEPAVTGYTTTYDNCAGVTLSNGETETCTITNNDQPGTLIVKKAVINDNGGSKVASNFSFQVDGAGAIRFVQDGEDPLKGLNTLTVNAGVHNVTEPAVWGYSTTYNGCSSINVTNGGTSTCIVTNDDQPGRIIIRKQTKPANTGTFSFTVTGTAYENFDVNGGAQNEQLLNVGSYTVTELPKSSWILTGIGGSPDPSTPYACVVTGLGGSTGVGNLATMTASINLRNGDTVTCTFDNTSSGATRTQGFWQTHPQIAEAAWFGESFAGHAFPGVVTRPGIGDLTFCFGPDVKTVDSLGKLMGGFWSSIPKNSDGKQRSNTDQARMQLLQQLLAAQLNAAAFDVYPVGGAAKLTEWEQALCSGNVNAISRAHQEAGQFNSSGDDASFTPGVAADSKYARDIADIPYWNTSAIKRK